MELAQRNVCLIGMRKIYKSNFYGSRLVLQPNVFIAPPIACQAMALLRNKLTGSQPSCGASSRCLSISARHRVFLLLFYYYKSTDHNNTVTKSAIIEGTLYQVIQIAYKYKHKLA